MSIIAVVPLKRLEWAKQRLSACLSEQERVELVLAMAADVLSALQKTAAIDEIWLISDAAQAAELAAKHGAIWRSEDEFSGTSSGLNAVAAAAAAASVRAGHAGLLLAHADLPLLLPADVEQLVAAWKHQSGQKRLALAPAHDGGTSLLLCTPDERLQFQYGRASAARHQLMGFSTGFTVVMQRLDGAMWDIDTPADLRRLRSMIGAGCGVSRTARLLREREEIRRK